MNLAIQLLTFSGIALALWMLLVILLYLICRACPSHTPHPNGYRTAVPRCTCSDLYVSGIVKNVPDGDGFSFSPHCPIHPNPKDISVRLAGIDAPEMPKPAKKEPGQPFAQHAVDFLKKLVHGRTLYIDKYGIEDGLQFAWAFLPQEGSLPLNVNLEMVKEGLADIYEDKVYRYGDYQNQILALLEEAKSNRRGFWSLVNEPNFKRPKDHKKKGRAEQNHPCKQEKKKEKTDAAKSDKPSCIIS